jgi:hypothetical protein
MDFDGARRRPNLLVLNLSQISPSMIASERITIMAIHVLVSKENLTWRKKRIVRLELFSQRPLSTCRNDVGLPKP